MVSPEEHTPAYKIFHYYFVCYISEAFVNNTLGGQISNNIIGSEHDETGGMVTKQLTIAEMAEYHDSGAKIELQNPELSVQMYEWLNKHLNVKLYGAKYSLNGAPTPERDIEKLDNFAAELFKVARNYQEVDSRDDYFTSRIDKLFGRRNMRRNRLSEDNFQDDGRVDIPEHRSVADEIITESLNRQLPDSK